MMPFFTVFNKTDCIRYEKNNKIRNDNQYVISVTLQVRIPDLIIKVWLRLSESGKRVLSSTLCSKAAGSLTIEAAMVLSLFLFAMVILMMPMRIINENRKLQATLEQAGKMASQYAYILTNRDQEEQPENSWQSSQSGMPEIISEAGILLYAGNLVKQAADSRRVQQISLLRSSVLQDGETIDLILDYKFKLPFSVFSLDSIPMTIRSNRRAWIGKKGGADSEKGQGDGEDEIVFVGKNRTRYHRSRTCHYLYNDISSVSYGNIETLRNAEGKRYQPCSRCGNGAGKGSVYIMPSGDKYHWNRNCSSIVAYAEAILLSKVQHLGPCSYCSK